LSVRGVELSKVLYPDVAEQYWHSSREILKRSKYEESMAKFIAVDVQLECFKDFLDLFADDGTPFTISVHPWNSPYHEAYPVVEFSGEWIVQPKAPAKFYVPPYVRRFLQELRGK
jgi:hypothetical protein